MLPSILSRQVRLGVEDHLRASFSPTTRGFDQIIEDFIARPDTLLKGPWVSVEMPFRRSEQTEEFFPSIPMGFRPYKHQEKAFRRLAGAGSRSTLIATGTGSGKTECFTLPILDACVRAKGRPGIKAIIIYPMNALAADQARRLASIVAKNPALAGVRVGMYADERPENPSDEMTPTSVIDMREALVRDPPDILLTNYKMLDYMLVRPDERELWEKNGPETLRYLVVDELHTFDGAQGTDLACLVRRLKSRLGMSKGSLCCVGTSATLGGGGAAKAGDKESGGKNGSLDDLLGYATAVFDENFDRDAVVTENRQSVDEYLNGIDVTAFDTPSAATVGKLANNAAEMGRVPFLAETFARWFGEVPPSEVDGDEWRVKLGERLNGHAFLQGLLRITRGKPMVVGEICREVVRSKHFKGWTDFDVECLLDSFLALVAHARRVDEPGSKSLRPFLNLRHQLWLREMRRMVASVGYEPRLAHFDDLLQKDQERSLPVVHCRSCGGAGWVTVDSADTNKPLWSEPKDVYSAYFGYSTQLRYIFLEEPIVRGRRTKASQSFPATLCSECLCYEGGDAEVGQACPRCQADADKRIKVFIYAPGHYSRSDFVVDHDCAFCRSPSGMGILGAQSVTLVSGMVGTIFGSDFNDDRKLLTFSDSVQDAAHRAAVLQARNASTVFRAGLGRFICEAIDPPSLDASLKGAPASMRSGQPEVEDFVATYMPADLEWWQDYEALLRDDALPAGSRLPADLERRLSWETFSELTFKSRLGNTTERSGVAVAHVDAEDVLKLASELCSRLSNELGEIWTGVGHPVIRRFLLGFLDHMRARGAVATDVTRLFVDREAKWFTVHVITGRVLPNIAPRAPKPVFPSRGNVEGFENVAAEGSDGWYRSWFHACFDQEVTLASGQSSDFYALVFRLMETLGIAERMPIGGRDPNACAAWGLNPDRVMVFSEPALLKCTTCGNSHRVPQKYSGLWEGVCCTRIGCNGILADASESDLARYRAKGLTTGRITRVLSAEHTSLLDREERHLVESRFMSATPRTWYPNLLAATPTLEMGINIGDLSTLVLCSVPPEQSNYVQRIGRTGRRDGNSLNVTVAMARPHDMWFWTDPAEMISGEVKTPGVHLKAIAILRRQYAAFTLDKWVQTKGAGVRSYGKVGDALRAIDTGNRAMFPLCWFDFVAQNADVLFGDFAVLFPEAVEDREDFERLHGFAHGGEVDGLAHFVACEYGDIAAEIQSIMNMIAEAKSSIQKLKKSAVKDLDHDEQIERLEFEMRALRRIRDEVKKLDNLGFMTERGVLPNYAFPSAPISLKSILSRLEPRTDGKTAKEAQEATDQKKDRDALILEYSRPSAAALSEFAPGARFYAKGRKVKIDQIDLSASPIEYWRVCPDCIHVERATQANESGACPACGSEMWADVGSRRPMIRLKQVLATGSDRSARIADDGDERDITRFDRGYLPAIDKNQVADAYAIDDGSFPFGFEFLRQCTFREFNFGEKRDAPTGQKIAGNRRSGHGFEICSSCGKVQDPRVRPRDGEVGLHLARCKEAKTATDKTFVSVVYIFREFSSEAVRILLPLATSYDESAVGSLSAAIDLGLKLHFKGKVAHLKTTVVEVKEGPLTRRYLFVYDTVPGGTGYLKQVASKPDEMLAVFDKARAHMVACACNEDADKDGCPRCIRSYGAVVGGGGVSRNKAVGLLNEIIAEWDKLTKVATVSDVKLNKALESELEQAFVDRLRSSVKASGGVFKKIVMAGKPGYFVKLGEATWNVELQCVLHERFPNVPATRADFVFWPAVPTPGSKPLAVYLDGWQFHAANVAEDLALRQKLVRSGHMNVWSATWDDVVKKESAEAKLHYWEPLASNNTWVAQLEKVCGDDAPALDALHFTEQRPFEQLLSYLRDPAPELWIPRARALALGWFISGFGAGKDKERIAGLLSKFAGEEATITLEDGDDPVRWGMLKVDGVGVVATVVHGKTAAPGPDATDLTVAIGVQHRIDESSEAKIAWNGALRLLNVVQFLPYFYVGCVGGIDLAASLRATEEAAEFDGWDEIEGNVLSSMMSIVAAMRHAKVPAPEFLFEAVDDGGGVLGTIELAWPLAKVGLVPDAALADAFPGWNIIVHQGGAEVPPRILEMAP